MFAKDPVEKHLITQESLLKWLYNVNCKINSKLNEKNKNFAKLCSYYENFKAGSCKKKNHKGKTCRRKTLKLPASHKLEQSKTNSSKNKK